jgi:hypothetical protein
MLLFYEMRREEICLWRQRIIVKYHGDGLLGLWLIDVYIQSGHRAREDDESELFEPRDERHCWRERSR